MATTEVKEEQKVYVCLPSNYDKGEHILSWALSHFPKDETKIVATVMVSATSSSNPLHNELLNQRREMRNKTLNKHLAKCAIQKFKAEKLIHENYGDLVEGTLELIDLKAIKNLVMWSSTNESESTINITSASVAERANPSCKIWFIENGNLIYTRYPKSDLTQATSDERREKLHQKEIEENKKRENESSMATTEVKEEQKVYVCLPWSYDEGKHILLWALSHFPKDETKIVVTYIGPTSYRVFRNMWWKIYNENLDKHLFQCAIQKFKAEKLIHEIDHLVEGTLSLIDLREITNLVMGFSPTNSEVSASLIKKANPTCNMWFIRNGKLLLTRYPRSDLTESSSKERREKLHQKEIEENQKRENESSMATTEVKEEQKVYVCLPCSYDEGKHILSWALSHFPKDETKIIAIYIGPTSYRVLRNMWWKIYNENLDKHLAQCAIQEFKAEKLIHEIDNLVEGTLSLIDSREITNLVMGFSPTNSEVSASLIEKANPTCNIWLIHNGKLLLTRYPRSDLAEASSEERIRKEKLHQKEIEEIQKRENDKNDFLRRGMEELKFENQLLKNQLKDLDKLKQERDNAIKEAQELRKQKEHSFADSDMVLSSQFSLSEMEQATQNFSDSLKIGEGGFGCVFKGSLRNTTVAIKKLNSESLQGLSEFQQEVAILNRVRHPNIVNLIGSCSEISTLVYEFLPNGSLEDRLACADNTSSLTWQARIRIIWDICLGLVFLHSNKPHLVIHGDLKPDNILLDANFISKLSDFGISKIIKQSDTNTTALYRTTHPAGTFAYIDPQFHSTGELTPKSDVYSFGIIVLRLLTGKRPLNIANEVQEGMRAGSLLSIVDQSAGKWPFDLAKKLAKLGLRCVDISRRRRPDMSQVWATIEPLVKVASQFHNEERVPSHFICPIMQEIMKNPCIAADGFTYEGEAIKTWLNGGRNTSPMTNSVIPHHDLIPNHVLRSAIQEWLQQHPQSN